MKFIKKHKYKLLTLMLSIVSIFTLFLGINKTYAYTDTEVSRTLDGTTSSIKTIGNYSGYLLNDNFNAFRFTFKDSNRVVSRGDVLLVNIAVFDSNNNLVNSTNNSVGIGDTYRLVYNTFAGTYRAFYYRQYLINDTYNSWCYYIATDTFVGNNYYYLGLNYYDSSLKYLVLNIDITNITNVNTDYYYDTYYEEIETNYNTLLNQYNDLQDNYDTLEVQYGDLQDDYEELQSDYDTLQSNYNDLNGNINNLNNFYNYGFIAFMKNGYIDSNDNVYSTRLTIYYVDRNSNTFLIKEYPLTLNDISSYFGGSSFSLYDLANHYINLLKDSITNFNDLYYINSCNLFIELQALFNIEYLDFINYEFTYDMELFIRNSIDNIAVYFNQLDTNNTNINSTKILEKNNNLKQFNTIEFDNISYDSDSYEPFITLNNVASAYYNNGVNDGYQRGLQQGRDSQQSIINDLNNQVYDLNNQVDSLERSNRVLQEQISSMSSDYNLNNLMWTIASTPFESFKQIWNVNFLGVNITQMVTGLLTAFIVLYIVKKFFL